MSLSQAVSLEALTALSEAEKSDLEKLQAQIKAGDKEAVARELSECSLRLLYAYSERSPEINKLCEESAYLTDYWASLLYDSGCPDSEIISFDRTMKLSLFSQIKGSFLLLELGKHNDLSSAKALSILNKACEIGMHQALIMRLNHYADKITHRRERHISDEQVDNYVHMILNDVNKISRLYWTMGCLDATFILFSIMNYYLELPEQKSSVERFFAPAAKSDFSWPKKYKDKTCPFPVVILETALENLYIARLITDMPESKIITNQLSKGKGEFAGFEDTCTSYQDMQTLVIERMNELHVPLIVSFCDSAFKQAVATVKRHHPDYGVPQELIPVDSSRASALPTV